MGVFFRHTKTQQMGEAKRQKHYLYANPFEECVDFTFLLGIYLTASFSSTQTRGEKLFPGSSKSQAAQVCDKVCKQLKWSRWQSTLNVISQIVLVLVELAAMLFIIGCSDSELLPAANCAQLFTGSCHQSDRVCIEKQIKDIQAHFQSVISANTSLMAADSKVNYGSVRS